MCLFPFCYICCRYTQLKEQYDDKKLQCELVWARLEQSTHHQQIVQLQQLKQDIQQQREILKQAKETEKIAKRQLKDIQEKLAVR